MENKRLDFLQQEAGCLIWLAPMSLGGLSPAEFTQIWMGEGEETVKDLGLRGAMMPVSLYQDDGYLVRFVLGDLTEEEKAEWTARVRWKLNVPCGKVLVSGVLDDDFEDWISELTAAENNGEYFLGSYVEVPAGEYLVEVYSYPPGDLSTGWGQIEEGGLFPPMHGIKRENPLKYFQRTRPDEEPPDWIKNAYDFETQYINFITRLAPLDEELPLPTFEEDGCIAWEFRKPEICPIGIKSDFKG